MDSREERLRREIVETGKRLYAKGYVAASDGNISARLDSARLLATPSGVSKGFMKPEALVVVDYAGNLIAGDSRPSSEIQMHLLIYKTRPDANAVVHAHPPVATGYAASGLALDKPIVAEAVLTLGSVPLAPYGTPGTLEVARGLEALVPEHDAILLANHGAVTFGENLEKALFKMETLEHIAEISLVSNMLGQQQPLTQENIKKLLEIKAKAAAPKTDSALSQEEAAACDVAETIVREILKRKNADRPAR